MIAYEEIQRFLWFAYAIVGVCGAAMPAAVLLEGGGQDFVRDLATAVSLGVLPPLALLNLLALRTRVEENRLHVALGRFFPMLWGNVPLSEIERVEVVEYRPLRDAGGWGMRWGKFGGEFCRFWNARGHGGVRFYVHGAQYIIGSQHPEELARALTGATARQVRAAK